MYPGFSSDRYEKLRTYAVTAAGLRHALRMAHLTPDNIPLIYDVGASEFQPTPLGQFLFRTTAIVEKIGRRNIALKEHANIDEVWARRYAFDYLGIGNLPAWTDPKKRSTYDYRASAEEVARSPELISPQEITGLIDIFAWASHLKEQRRHIVDLTNAWREFRVQAQHHSVLHELVPLGKFMNRLADEGVDTVIEKGMKSPSRAAEIAQVLSDHAIVASSYGVTPRTAEIKAILAKYTGYMHPFIYPYRKHAEDVVRERRQDFDLPYSGTEGTRQNFLTRLRDMDLIMELHRQGLSITKVKEMVRHGSFGQEKGATNPNLLTVEHMTPLTAGDNFSQNFALSTAGANADTNRLVRLQTDFLPGDEVVRSKDVITWTMVAPTVNIVALRPRLFRYGDGKVFPAFIRHPGWDWKA